MKPATRRALWIALLLLATALRLPHPDWDGGIAVHPDERFLLGVAEGTPLGGNPCTTAEGFPYGHLPVYAARLLVLAAPKADPLLAARLLSALVSVLLVALAGAWGQALTGEGGGLLAAAVLAMAPFPLQTARFFTVDPFAAALASGAVLAAARASFGWAGALAGLALASKSSLAPLAAPLLLAAWRPPRSPGSRGLGRFLKVRRRGKKTALRSLPAPAEQKEGFSVCRMLSTVYDFMGRWDRRGLLQTGGSALAAFALAAPWSLLAPVACWEGPLVQAGMVAGRYLFPYTRQYLGTLPLVYPLTQMALWGLGPVAALGGLAGPVVALPRWRRLSRAQRVGWAWAAAYFLATGALFVKFPRYLLPVYPAWSAWAAWAVTRLPSGWVRRAAAPALLLPTLLLGVAQLSVYGRPHPWQAASTWIYANVRPGDRVAVEHWEHALPVPAPEGSPRLYRGVELPVHALEEGDEGEEKAEALSRALDEAHVVVLASRRGYGALARDPDGFAGTLDWYETLLGEREAVTFARCPRLGPLAITDDPLADAGLPVPTSLAERCGTPYALRLPRLDESFRVYDAPLALVLPR
jgi:hypothetical protein